jgi:hypothetical protein
MTVYNQVAWTKCSSSFEAFTAVMFHVESFWVVMPRTVLIGYQCFGGPCFLHLQVEPLKRWYPTTTPHDVTTQKISAWNLHFFTSTVYVTNSCISVLACNKKSTEQTKFSFLFSPSLLSQTKPAREEMSHTLAQVCGPLSHTSAQACKPLESHFRTSLLAAWVIHRHKLASLLSHTSAQAWEPLSHASTQAWEPLSHASAQPRHSLSLSLSLLCSSRTAARSQHINNIGITCSYVLCHLGIAFVLARLPKVALLSYLIRAAFADSRDGVVLQPGVWAWGLTTDHKNNCYEMFHRYSDGFFAMT